MFLLEIKKNMRVCMKPLTIPAIFIVFNWYHMIINYSLISFVSDTEHFPRTGLFCDGLKIL